jgi:cysteinyl-tRNA synthetase
VQELDSLQTTSQPISEEIKIRVYAIRSLGSLLGLFFDSLESVEAEGLRVVGRALGVQPLTVGEVQALLQERVEARAAKNFARSDELRTYLTARGVDVLDTKAGSSWRFA